MAQIQGGDLFFLWNYSYRKLIVVEAVGVQDRIFDYDWLKMRTNHTLGKIVRTEFPRYQDLFHTDMAAAISSRYR